jgi:hypothetical protein
VLKLRIFAFVPCVKSSRYDVKQHKVQDGLVASHLKFSINYLEELELAGFA